MKGSTLEKKNSRIGWTMVIIASVLILAFSYIPMVQAFLLSLKTGKGNNLTFGGVANYVRMLNDTGFKTTIGNTLFYAVIQIPIMLLLALLVAVLLNSETLKLRGFYRTCIFLPCVTSPISYAILFKNIFATDGVVNHVLLSLGLINSPIAFILDPVWAKFVIIIALIWRYSGYYMIFFLSALQNTDKSVYEAAKIDGANFRQSFFKITMPILKPIIFLTSIMAVTNTLQLFDEVVNLTGGGPGNATRTISEYIYDLSFNYVPNYGYAAAVSYVVLVMMILGIFLRVRVCYWLAIVGVAYMYFRMLSRNISARYAENQAFLKHYYRLTGWFFGKKSDMTRNKGYHIYKCPQCRQKVRVPKGKGKISIHCPKCGNDFIKRS